MDSTELKKNASAAALVAFAKMADERMDDIERREIPGIYEPTAFTIPTSGWGTDDSVPDFPNYYDVFVAGITEQDVVDVVTAPNSARTARRADFAPVQTYAGKFRLRCKKIPTAEIEAEYQITDAIARTGGLSVET